MKVALITDTHWGARGDSVAFLKHHVAFHDMIFFPELRERKIKRIIHLGDLFDKRKLITFTTANKVRVHFTEPVVNEFNMDILVGNHDAPLKNTIYINGIDELYSFIERGNVVRRPEEIEIDGTKILMLPWICPDNEEESLRMIAASNARFCFGHLELNGFEMSRGHLMDHGMNAGMFSKFERVFSGHYHRHQEKDNIVYLGAPYEKTWDDYGDPHGFHIFDTKTGELEFVENPWTMHHKFQYDDTNWEKNESSKIDYPQFTDRIVKIVVAGRKNAAWFDDFVKKVHAANPVDVQVVDNPIALELENGEEAIDLSDTLQVMQQCVETVDIPDTVKREDFNDFVLNLYQEAKKTLRV